MYQVVFIFFPTYIKMTNNYYQKHKERLQKEACKQYQNLPEKSNHNSEKKSEKDIKFSLN